MPPSHSHIETREIQFSNAELLPEVVRLLNEGHTATIRLRGISMRPFLEDNRDKAVLTRPTNPQVGDPVLAEIRPGFYVLHRIIDIQGDAVTLLGDGNPKHNHEHCKKEDIRGAVVGFYRRGSQRLDRTDGRKWRLYSWYGCTPYPSADTSSTSTATFPRPCDKPHHRQKKKRGNFIETVKFPLFSFERQTGLEPATLSLGS